MVLIYYTPRIFYNFFKNNIRFLRNMRIEIYRPLAQLDTMDEKLPKST